jgi:cytochrome c
MASRAAKPARMKVLIIPTANKSSGIVWSAEGFDKYIRAPMQEMPGTRMAFVGIKNDKDISDLWAYLKQFGPDGVKK